MPLLKLHKTVGVKVGAGPGRRRCADRRPVDDDDRYRRRAGDGRAIIELAAAGSEMVRVTVNLPEAAAAVPEIKQRMLDAGCTAPLIGDFHYNGHLLLTRFPDCARALDKYRINPGNVGTGTRRDEQFATICKVAVDCNKPVRIGVNGGSLNQELVTAKMQENTDRDLGRTSEEIINECMVLSAVQSTALAIESGLRKDQIIISCKTSRPRDLIAVYRELARRTDQPLHLGLTEAGMGLKGLVWSASAMGVLLAEGIGDTVRVSLTPQAGRRPARRSLRRLRAAPGPWPSRVLAQRHRLSWLRADDQLHVSGARRTHSGLHSRKDAGMEDRVRRRRIDDARGDGLRGERTGRIEGGEHRDQPAGHRRGAQLSHLHRRRARHDPSRHLRGARGGIPASGQ